MSLSFVLVGSQIKRFRTVVKALAGIGSELLVEALPEKLILRAINSAHSAFLAVSLSSQFFESYNVFSQKGVVQAGVLIKHLLATFRSTRVASMACELNEEQASLRVNLRCDNGLMKRYGLDINSTDILQANLDSAGLPVSVVAEAPELNKLLNTFQSTLDEVSIIALPDQLSTAGTGTHGQAAAARCVKLQSFYDPAKAAGSKALHTCMALATTHVFKSYSNSASAPSDVTINLKDLKTLVGLCVELGADVVLKFDEAGVPLLALPHAPGQQAMDYTAELILSTLQESVHRPEDDDAAWQQQDPAAAAGGANGVPAAAAERTETIAPASVTRGGDMAAAGAAETPQGPGAAGSASVLRFRQTRAPSAAAAAAGGGVSGGGAFSGGARSGGRSRSGGVSRFDQLEAALAEEEARQQQEQQYIQQQCQQQYSTGAGPTGVAAAGTSMGPPAAVSAAAAGAGLVTPISRPQQQQQQPHWAQQQDTAGVPQQQQQQWGQQPQQQWGQPSQQQQQWGHQVGAVPQGLSQEAGQASLECSLTDVEALPRHGPSRSPAPNAAAAAAAVVQADLPHHHQQQQQEQPWAGFPQQQQQQQQQQEGGVYEGGGELEGMDEDEELPETPEGSEQGDMDTGGLGEL